MPQPLAVTPSLNRLSHTGDERLPVLADGPRDLPAHSDDIVIQGAAAAMPKPLVPTPAVAVGYR